MISRITMATFLNGGGSGMSEMIQYRSPATKHKIKTVIRIDIAKGVLVNNIKLPIIAPIIF
jgi:hypothetical protein